MFGLPLEVRVRQRLGPSSRLEVQFWRQCRRVVRASRVAANPLVVRAVSHLQTRKLLSLPPGVSDLLQDDLVDESVTLSLFGRQNVVSLRVLLDPLE